MLGKHVVSNEKTAGWSSRPPASQAGRKQLADVVLQGGNISLSKLHNFVIFVCLEKFLFSARYKAHFLAHPIFQSGNLLIYVNGVKVVLVTFEDRLYLVLDITSALVFTSKLLFTSKAIT